MFPPNWAPPDQPKHPQEASPELQDRLQLPGPWGGQTEAARAFSKLCACWGFETQVNVAYKPVRSIVFLFHLLRALVHGTVQVGPDQVGQRDYEYLISQNFFKFE